MLGEPAEASVVAGYWQGDGQAVPMYVGVGDHQCSVLGSALSPGNAANINLGTGSQLAVIDRRLAQDVEMRPYFDGSRLDAVTHVPAGRSLAEYVGFLAGMSDQSPDRFWQRLAELEEEDVRQASLQIDLSIFEGARDFKGGGSIGGILEGSLNLSNYLASLLKALVDQYVEVLETFDPDGELERCVLSGGIARNLPNLAALLSRRSGREVSGATELDESLLGLRTLALQADGRAANYLEAQQVFGRHASVRDS